jgi:hypothetical protein
MKKRKPQTKREVIVAAWQRRPRRAAGEKELLEMQRALAERFGEGAVDSPAVIARVLADEGAELRHPELIEFDARWRQANIKKLNTGGGAPMTDKPLTLARAVGLTVKLEKARKRFDRKGDQTNLRGLRDLAITEKQHAESLARNPGLNNQTRSEQAEIAEWLRVWLQTPNLFEDWLDLRRRSPDFRKKFPSEIS